MNANQKFVLVVAGVLLAVNLLFPPWERTFRGDATPRFGGAVDRFFTTTTFDGYGFIGRSGTGLSIDAGRLFGQCLAIGIMAAIAFVCVADKKR